MPSTACTAISRTRTTPTQITITPQAAIRNAIIGTISQGKRRRSCAGFLRLEGFGPGWGKRDAYAPRTPGAIGLARRLPARNRKWPMMRSSNMMASI